MTTRSYKQSTTASSSIKVVLPVLPNEIWTEIISSLEFGALLAMSDTCALFKSLVSDPNSNMWSKTLSFRHQNGTLSKDITVTQILRNYSVIHKSKQLEITCTPRNPLTILHLFSINHCQCCSTKTSKVYSGFKARLCDICVHEKSISESALIHIVGEGYTDELPHEHLGMLLDCDGIPLNGANEIHYWVDTISDELGIDLYEDEDVNEMFSMLQCRHHSNYVNRKLDVLDAMRLFI